MEAVHSGCGVFYQAMPAVGADGKNIMKLIPVQMLNGQFVQTQMSKPRVHSTTQPAVNISSVPLPMSNNAVLNPSTTQKIVKKQISFVKVLPDQAPLVIGNSPNKHLPQQQSGNVTAKVSQNETTRRLTVKSPALPRGHCLKIPTNAQVRTVPASELSPGIKKHIFMSSANSSAGSGQINVVYVSPVTTVNQSVAPSGHSHKPVSKTSDNNVFESQAKGLKPLLKLIPKVSQRPNSPIKWEIEEEESSMAPISNPLTSSSVTAEIPQAVTKRENPNHLHDATQKQDSHLSQRKNGQEQENALVMCNGRVFFVAKKCSLPFKMSKNETAVKQNNESNENIVPSTQQHLKSVAVQTQQNVRITISDEPDEVIDLCDDDDDQDDNNVAFVSYCRPKSTHNSMSTTQMTQQKGTDQRDTSRSNSITKEKCSDGAAEVNNLNKGCTKQEAGVEAGSPQDPSTSDISSGTCSQEQEDHKMKISPNTALCWTTSPEPKPCQMTDHLLRQVFGITADVKICLQRIDEASAGPVPADFMNSLQDYQEPLNGLKENKPLLEDLYQFCVCSSSQSSHKGASCEDTATVTGYMEPIGEDLPCTDADDIPQSQERAAKLQTQICVDLNTNARRVGRTRKRTMCPCCIPGALQPAVKSSVRLEVSESCAWMTEHMSKRRGMNKFS